ncbi:hypothetical protein F5Y19DRAFT_321090 [Xylariaceae sp. FL1651]|nr:hypothetical protein F5Y19DRAFT_321090 [Xylariaceae sp. FL1651]
MLFCDEDCQTEKHFRKKLSKFVKEIMLKIRKCGFHYAVGDISPAGLRLANPGSEQNWWAKVDVNQYNMTNLGTDPVIMCLRAIQDSKTRNHSEQYDLQLCNILID